MLVWPWLIVHVLCACLQVNSCCCKGCNVEMWGLLANGQTWSINNWGDSITQSHNCVLVDSFVGTDSTLRGRGCVLKCVRVEYKARLISVCLSFAQQCLFMLKVNWEQNATRNGFAYYGSSPLVG